MSSIGGKHGEAAKIRVLIANLSGIIAELITQSIEHQLDIELLGSVKTWDEVNSLISAATIFVIGFEDQTFSSQTCLPLLNEYPQLKILVLNTERNEGIVYWRVLHCQGMQVISAQSFIESIRHTHSLIHIETHEGSSFPQISC